MPNHYAGPENPKTAMNARAKAFFTSQLVYWNTHVNGRKMPWKGEKNPYRIWLSEIILQQTRVDQGWDYYNRFVEKYPTVQQLAAAPESEVFKLWEGLGYYSRCKNVIATARYIASDLNGQFPDQYTDILALKGIGPYTAAAIASFAFNLPFAVVDGNVYRVLARYFAIKTPIDTTEGKYFFAGLATTLLDKSAPGAYNQGLMDLGATICKPQPLCGECPLQKKCIAFNSNTTQLYPVKSKKIIRKTRWFYYLVAEYKETILIRKREQDIWQNLHELVLIESNSELTLEAICTHVIFTALGTSTILDISPPYSQHLTHQTIKGQFIHIRLKKAPRLQGYTAEKRSAISKLAFPRFITTYFADSRLLNS